MKTIRLRIALATRMVPIGLLGFILCEWKCSVFFGLLRVFSVLKLQVPQITFGLVCALPRRVSCSKIRSVEYFTFCVALGAQMRTTASKHTRKTTATRRRNTTTTPEHKTTPNPKHKKSISGPRRRASTTAAFQYTSAKRITTNLAVSAVVHFVIACVCWWRTISAGTYPQ